MAAADGGPAGRQRSLSSGQAPPPGPRRGAAERSKIEAVSQHLKQNNSVAVIIEGNCDDRGTEEYNRALGERRAIAVRNALQAAGVQDDRMKTISYGKDRPAVEGSSEEARAKNRRGELVPAIKNK